MSKLDNTMRLALSAVLVASFALPHSADAQGKSKGKGKPEKAEKGKTEKDDHDRGDDKARVVRSDAGTIVVVPRPVTVTRLQPVKGKKHVTTPQAVVVTRQVLLANGFTVTEVAPLGAGQVVYFRRGNMGRGRGLGPVERLYIVPAGDVVRFQSVPPTLLSTILARLGLQ